MRDVPVLDVMLMEGVMVFGSKILIVRVGGYLPFVSLYRSLDGLEGWLLPFGELS
jgi:hypothetical protein